LATSCFTVCTSALPTTADALPLDAISMKTSSASSFLVRRFLAAGAFSSSCDSVRARFRVASLLVSGEQSKGRAHQMLNTRGSPFSPAGTCRCALLLPAPSGHGSFQFALKNPDAGLSKRRLPWTSRQEFPRLARALGQTAQRQGHRTAQECQNATVKKFPCE
jgi:hypothetical protein